MAIERSILTRRKRRPTRLAQPSDFSGGRARRVELRDAFRGAPADISPYALDIVRREVVFVRTAGVADLALAHPFYYQAQRSNARSTLVASFDEVEALGNELESAEMRLAFLYSPGRAGSTIAGKIASSFPGVQSLSEPDIYSHAATLRQPGNHELDRTLERMVRAATRILCANRAAIAPDKRILFVKQRSFGIFGAPVIHAALPSARAIYLDRNPAAVVDSYLGAFLGKPVYAFGRSKGLDRYVVAALRRIVRFRAPWIVAHMPEVLDVALGASKEDGVVEFLARAFVAMSAAAKRYEASGLVRFQGHLLYETYEKDVAAFARQLASAIGIEQSEALDMALSRVPAISAVDAQAGSTVSSPKATQLTDADLRRIERVTRSAAVEGRESAREHNGAAKP